MSRSREAAPYRTEHVPEGVADRPAPEHYAWHMLRPASWSRPAGESPVRVSTGAPDSRPRFVGEIRRAERGVESLFGGSNTAGRSVQANFAASSKPQRESRAAHVTAKAMSEGPRSGVRLAGLSGVRKMARGEGLGWNRRDPSVHALVGAETGGISRW